MWIIRGLILLIGVVALIWIATQNAGTKVTFYLFTRMFVDIELNVIIVVTFITGMLVWAIGAWIREAQLLFRIARFRKDMRNQREEIADLRNLPLEEEAYLSEPEQD